MSSVKMQAAPLHTPTTLTLAAIRDSTDPRIEADEAKAGAALLRAIEYEEPDETMNHIKKGSVADLGDFVFYVWRKTARYALCNGWTFYVRDNQQPEHYPARYLEEQHAAFAIDAEEHMRKVLDSVIRIQKNDTNRNHACARNAELLHVRSKTTDFVELALARAHRLMQHAGRLESCGLQGPAKFRP